MRILGLDVGSRTIGVACSDPLLLTAQGMETIRRQSQKKDFARLKEIIKEKSILYKILAFNYVGKISELFDKIIEHLDMENIEVIETVI